MERNMKWVQSIKKAVFNAKQLFRSALYVKDIKCITCNAELKQTNKYCMCETCLQKLPYTSGRICYKCGDAVFGSGSYCLNCKGSEKPYEFARAPFTYDGKIKTLIYELKYSRGKFLAPYLSFFLLDEFAKQNWNIDMIIPVPLYYKRQKKRGFNQAELLSVQFKNKFNYEVNTTCLVRNKNTPTQTRLTKKERKSNLDKAFLVTDKQTIKNKNILLIDDVFTTGATMEECSKVLKKAGVKNIYILTLAHVKQSIPTY
jgi:ComF family protein